ncbi:MAG: hypothetical protein GY869_32950, partial [Planctomycetes bacterium]|nr:hypothetical protein [Planctomycetota bacterium]
DIPAGGGCAQAYDSTQVVIDQDAIVDAGINDTICEGETVALTAVLSGSATTVSWTSSGDGSFDFPASATPIYTPGANDITNMQVTLTVTTNDPVGIRTDSY